MTEVSHEDILVRIEDTEKDVAVLGSKINRVQKDITQLGGDVKDNGKIARETQTQIRTLGRVILGAVTMAGFILALLGHVSG